jgi:hypothetical protein
MQVSHNNNPITKATVLLMLVKPLLTTQLNNAMAGIAM